MVLGGNDSDGWLAFFGGLDRLSVSFLLADLVVLMSDDIKVRIVKVCHVGTKFSIVGKEQVKTASAQATYYLKGKCRHHFFVYPKATIPDINIPTAARHI